VALDSLRDTLEAVQPSQWLEVRGELRTKRLEAADHPVWTFAIFVDRVVLLDTAPAASAS